MVSLSQRLGLRRPTGTDPFLRADFEYNWNRLDAHPGVFPCTSTSRPTDWGADQVGLLIHEIDTGQILRWTGPLGGGGQGFRPQTVYSAIRTVNVPLSVSVAPLTTFTQALPNLAPPREATLVVQGWVQCTGAPVEVDVLVDGTGVNLLNARVQASTLSIPVYGVVSPFSNSSHTMSVTVKNPSNPDFQGGGSTAALSRIMLSLSYANRSPL